MSTNDSDKLKAIERIVLLQLAQQHLLIIQFICTCTNSSERRLGRQ